MRALYRRADVQLGMVPDGAKMHLKYTETWANPQYNRQYEGDVAFQAGNVTSNINPLAVALIGDTLQIQAPTTNAYDQSELQKITLTTTLDFPMVGTLYKVVSQDDGTLFP
jgi:hypothetical protein